MTNKYSVLITVYQKEKAEFFDESLQSIINQTVKPNEIVIVCDGPLTSELNDVLLKYANQDLVRILRLDKNYGSGYAAQKGLEICSNEFVMRMDSDDISNPHRAELQLKELNKGMDFVAGAISEFDEDQSRPFAIKHMPLTKSQIISYSKKRNPFCNVTTFFRKSVVLNAGGYCNQLFLEDYTLAIKIIQSGANFINLPDVLVNVRSNQNQIARRSDPRLRVWFKKLRKYMLDTNYINRFQYFWYNFQTDVFCLSPSWIKRLFYRFLRGRK